MNMSHYSDTPTSPPTDSSCENRFDNRNSNFDFENPRFSERKSYPRTPSSISRSKPYIPYNSRVCLLFERGKCHYGEKCRFTHSTSEIRNLGGLFKPVAMKDQLNDDSGVCRIRGECFYFASGVDCPYGEKCQFLHKCDQRVNMDREICAINVSNQIPWRSLSAGGKYHDDKSDFRKTKLCNKWEWFGNCPYGVRCNYAHGKAELGFPPRPVIAESSEVARKIAKKLALKGRSYFTNWDIATISRIYADNCISNV